MPSSNYGHRRLAKPRQRFLAESSLSPDNGGGVTEDAHQVRWNNRNSVGGIGDTLWLLPKRQPADVDVLDNRDNHQKSLRTNNPETLWNSSQNSEE